MKIKLFYLNFLLAASLVLMSGCKKDESFIIKKQKSAGIIKSVSYIPAGFRQPPLTCIITPSGTFVIHGHVSVPNGIEAFITNASHLTWEGAPFRYFIH